jgi:ribosomal protein S6
MQFSPEARKQHLDDANKNIKEATARIAKVQDSELQAILYDIRDAISKHETLLRDLIH